MTYHCSILVDCGRELGGGGSLLTVIVSNVVVKTDAVIAATVHVGAEVGAAIVGLNADVAG